MSETSFNLISEKCDILSILRDHPENRIYQRKIQELSKRFTAIRKTKGDGNCFYRALGYSYLESLLGKGREILRFKERVLQTPNDLLAAGFEEHKFRNFFNAFHSVVELVEKDGSVSSLLKVFNDQGTSDRIVQFLRLLTSAFIRNRADFFRHFIDDEMDIKDFCTHVGARAAGLGDAAPGPGPCSGLCLLRTSSPRGSLTMDVGITAAGQAPPGQTARSRRSALSRPQAAPLKIRGLGWPFVDWFSKLLGSSPSLCLCVAGWGRLGHGLHQACRIRSAEATAGEA
uniref:ubiquitinyl hydrolase 1 n=1 Tax=Oryctolagus cuniculus TaxID=9986 RepID=A0A5F9CTD7_RABIT